MVSPPPLVSVCVATYNRRAHLEKTLESLARQTFEDFELLVCDDASTDGTREYLDSLRWPRLRVFHNDANLNLYGTFARLFKEARGQFVGSQHDHDLYEPEFLAEMVRTLLRHRSAGFACCGYHLIDCDGRRIGSRPSAEFSVFPPGDVLPGAALIRILATRVHTPIAPMGALYRRDIVNRVGGYLPDWGLASDEDLYRRVAAVADVAFCRKRLFSMRLRPPERQSVLGSWNSIRQTYRFRQDTTLRYFQHENLFCRVNSLRLTFRQNWAALLEGAQLWSRGNRAQLLIALEQPKDSGRPPLWQQWPGRILFSVLARTNNVGAWLGDCHAQFRKGGRRLG